MLKSHKIMILLSESRQRQTELAEAVNASADGATEEQINQRTALAKEIGALETEYRGHLTDEAAEEARAGSAFGDDGETAEVRRVLGAARVGNYMMHAVEGSAVDGAEKELCEALEIRSVGYGGGVAVPWRLFAEPVEKRADVASSTTQLSGPVNQASILQRIFAPTGELLDALGVRLDSAAPGQAQFPLLTAGVTASAKAESASATDAAVPTFATQTLTPKRITAKYGFTVEQAVEVAGIEAALRMDLAMAMRNEMARQVLNGDGNTPNVHGLLSRIAAPDIHAAVTTLAQFVSLSADAVDGLHAQRENECAVVLGVDGYKLAAKTYSTGIESSAIQQMNDRARVVLATSFMPDQVAATGAQAALVHAGADATRGDSIGVVWPAVSLIRDNVTQAAEGIVLLTAITLWDFYAAFRSAAYARTTLKLKA